jgi:eukaryotic-like serine/threonine-protein kinase
VERDARLGGRYRLREPLGAGGMSVVWRAEDEVLSREVAVKVMSAKLSAGPALIRLHDEARAAAALRHPNVVEVYDYGESEADGETVPYVVMELVSGRSLTDLLSAGPLSWPVAVLIAAQVAAALAAAHDRGVVHRDVKPANVMVSATAVKLVDFGISAAAGDRDSEPGTLLGTPAYLAPERLAGGVVRPSTDVYALGLLLYLMLAGHLPWQASTTTEMLVAHRYHDPAPLPPVAGLPADVAELCARCLDKRPEDRPSAAVVSRLLARVAGLPSIAEWTPVPAGNADELEPTVATAPDFTAGMDVPGATGVTGGAVHEASRSDGPTAGRRAVLAAVVLAVAAAAGVAWWRGGDRASSTAAPISCTVRYQVRDAAAGRAAATVTVVNDGTVPVENWRLAFRLPADQRLLTGSNARWGQDGEVVRADGAVLAPGAPVTTTVETAYRDASALPGAFTLNAVACRSDLSFQGRPATPSAPLGRGPRPVRRHRHPDRLRRRPGSIRSRRPRRRPPTPGRFHRPDRNGPAALAGLGRYLPDRVDRPPTPGRVHRAPTPGRVDRSPTPGRVHRAPTPGRVHRADPPARAVWRRSGWAS